MKRQSQGFRWPAIVVALSVMGGALAATAVAAAAAQQAGQVEDVQGVFGGGQGASGVHCVTGLNAQVHALGRVDAGTRVTINFNTPRGGDIVAHLIWLTGAGSAVSRQLFFTSNDDGGGSLDPRIISSFASDRDLILVVSRFGNTQSASSVCYNFKMALSPPSPF